MHPSGVHYGLSLGLLQFRGRWVVVSDRVFESISRYARWKISGRNRLTAIDAWDEFIREGLARVRNQFPHRRRKTTPFLMGFDGVVETSLIEVAEKTRVGRGLAKWLQSSELFDDEFRRRVQRLEFTEDMAKNRRLLFRVSCGVVRDLCARFDPDSLRHAEFLALGIYEHLHRAGCLEITVGFQRLNKHFELRNSCPIAGRRHYFRQSKPAAAYEALSNLSSESWIAP